MNARSLQRPRWIAAAIGLLASFVAFSGSSPMVGPRDDSGVSATQVAAGGPFAGAKGSGLGVASHVVAGGGGSSRGGTFVIVGTMGRADVDPLQPSTGGAFTVTGGFWAGLAPAAPAGDAVFANGFEPIPP